MERPATEGGLAQFLVARLRAVLADLQERDAPVTTALLALLALVFGQQVAVAWLNDVAIGDVAGYLFVEHTAWAWVLSPLLHRTVLHVAANLAMLALLGRVVEDVLGWRRYAGLLALAAGASTIGGFAFSAPFTAAPVAVYGASGMAYALATWALWLPARAPTSLRAAYRPVRLLTELRPAEEVAVLVGAAAVLQVLLDVVTGPYASAHWINGGHAVGALVGLAAGAWWRRSVGRRRAATRA